ncbi:MAG: hypothetical protein MZV65_53670 [Chromatiales bacterium]|nr:hypothetical protein [Chromatiales bacterium]
MITTDADRPHRVPEPGRRGAHRLATARRRTGRPIDEVFRGCRRGDPRSRSRTRCCACLRDGRSDRARSSRRCCVNRDGHEMRDRGLGRADPRPRRRGDRRACWCSTT